MIDALNTRAGMVLAGAVAVLLLLFGGALFYWYGWLLATIILGNVCAFSVLAWWALAVKIARSRHAPVVVRDKQEGKDGPARIVDGQLIPMPLFPNLTTYHGPIDRSTQQVPALPPPSEELRALGTVYYRDISARIPRGQMLIGVRPDASLRLGTLQDFRSCLFLAKSGNGKTVKIAQAATEAALNGARLIVADPHGNKEDGLLSLIGPLQAHLWPGSAFAIEDEDIRANLRLARELLDNRVAGAPFDCDLVVIVEEWNKLFDRDELQDDLVSLTRNLAREGRGFHVFGWWGAQDMSGANFAKYRKLCAAVMLGRVEYGDAQTLLHDSALAKQVMQFAPGASLFLDSRGDRELLQQPLFAQRDAIEAVYGGFHPFTIAPPQPALSLPPVSKTVPKVLTSEERERERIAQTVRDNPGASASAICSLAGISSNKVALVKRIKSEEGL